MTPDLGHEHAPLMPMSRTYEGVAASRWLLRMRWLAGLGVLVGTSAVMFVPDLRVPVLPLVLTGVTILAYNTLLWLWQGHLHATSDGAPRRHHGATHLQVALDWVAMAVLIVLTGGVESPLIFFFAFHIVIVSLLLGRVAAVSYTAAAVGLVTAIVCLEATRVIPHVHVAAFMPAEAAFSPLFVVGVLATFAVVSAVTCYLTSTIASQIRRREGQLATLYVGAQAITSTLELQEVLDQFVKATVEAMGVHGASIGLLDATGTRIEPAAAYGLSAKYLAKGSLVLDPAYVQGRVMVSGEPTIIDADAERSSLQYPSAVAAEGIRSILYVRLPGKTRPLGLMRAYSSRQRAFTQDDARFLVAIAAQGAAAIENAIAYQTLRQIDTDKSKFVRLVTHELRSPVNGALSQLHLLLDGYLGPLEAKQLDTLTRLKRRLQTLQSLINDLLDLAAGRAGLVVGETKPLDLPEALLRATSTVEAAATQKRLTVQLHLPDSPESLAVSATPDGLDRIFGNLLSNAVKYTPEGGAVVVNLRVEDGHAVVEVADTGIGIPAKALPKLFSEFYRAPNAKAFETGTGLGLVIVKELVERLGGRIAVESQEGQGSTFLVHLPLAAANLPS